MRLVMRGIDTSKKLEIRIKQEQKQRCCDLCNSVAYTEK